MARVLYHLGGERRIRAQLREYRRRTFLIAAGAPTAEEQRQGAAPPPQAVGDSALGGSGHDDR
jgi:hypothetical protein